MHITDAEYQTFKVHFHCTSVCDEQYLRPVVVDAAESGGAWIAYVEGRRFHEAFAWLDGWRKGSL